MARTEPLKHTRARRTPLFCAADVPEKLWNRVRVSCQLKPLKEPRTRGQMLLLFFACLIFYTGQKHGKTIGSYICAHLANFQAAIIDAFVALSVHNYGEQ